MSVVGNLGAEVRHHDLRVPPPSRDWELPLARVRRVSPLHLPGTTTACAHPHAPTPPSITPKADPITSRLPFPFPKVDRRRPNQQRRETRKGLPTPVVHCSITLSPVAGNVVSRRHSFQPSVSTIYYLSSSVQSHQSNLPAIQRSSFRREPSSDFLGFEHNCLRCLFIRKIDYRLSVKKARPQHKRLQAIPKTRDRERSNETERFCPRPAGRYLQIRNERHLENQEGPGRLHLGRPRQSPTLVQIPVKPVPFLCHHARRTETAFPDQERRLPTRHDCSYAWDSYAQRQRQRQRGHKHKYNPLSHTSTERRALGAAGVQAVHPNRP